MTTLTETSPGQTARLLSVDNRLRNKLEQYGLHIGDVIHVFRVAPLGGPILIKVNGREIALGRTIAEKILVEVE